MLEELERRHYAAKQTIFREGETGDLAYFVESGLVRISKLDGEKQAPLGIIEEGGLFGEMALIDDEPRMATAVAVRQTRCIVIPAREIRKKLTNADPLIRALLDIFVKNIRAQTALRLEAETVVKEHAAPPTSEAAE